MDHQDGADQAAAYAEQAMALMTQYNVAKTPTNFEVWYTHVSGRNESLSKALDILISNNQTFTPEQNSSIRGQYFDNQDTTAAIFTAGEEFGKSMGTVLDFLNEASSGVESYGKSLESNLGNMAGADSMEGLRRAIESLVSDTKGMQAQNQLLKNRLEKSSSKIETLRQNLENVQKEAMTDALTGIANRKFFDVCLRDEVAEAMESGENLCLMLGDIDHFKTFNDNYGHQIGDQVLKLVGMILKQETGGKRNVTPARYGGEEFAIVMPKVTLDKAKQFAETIRKTVGSKRIRKRSTGEDFGNITMSIGIALFKAGEPLGDLVQRADEGLYHAKATGRNRVVTERELEKVELES
jgi:diguanylate cyclase